MELRKVRKLLIHTVFLFIVAILSGCGGEPEENVAENKEVTVEQVPIQSTDTEGIGDLQPFDEIDFDEEIGTVQEVMDKSTAVGTDVVEIMEEEMVDTTDNIVGLAVESTDDVQDTILDVQEDATDTIEEAVAQPVAEILEDAEDSVVTTPDLMRRIQQALVDMGYNPGPVDGMSGPKTLNAIEQFQQDNNLASGELTKETLRSLGVAF